MRDPNRLDELYDRIKQVHMKNNDLRLGQFMIIILNKYLKTNDRDIFYIEDDEMIEIIENCFK